MLRGGRHNGAMAGSLIADLDRDPAAVAGMFDAVAPRYDIVNDCLSLGQARTWRAAVVRALAPRPGELLLDAAAGTATSSLPLAATGARVIACDFSQGMLAHARIRVGRIADGSDQSGSVQLIAGDTLALPFADHAFDAVTISFGLRNTVNPAAALTELRRVTRPGGRLVVCEFATPVRPLLRTVYREYLMGVLPAVAGAVSGRSQPYGYLARSIREWPSQSELADKIRATGWDAVAWRNLSGGIVALHRACRGGVR